jgi:Cdc6-like AAA superfamily ATPase
MSSTLEIKEEPNKKLNIMNSANHLDKQLADDIPEPLPNYSGFNFVISGASGSGKTTLLTSLMSAKKKNGVRQSYKKCFDKILICSPTLGQGKSMKSDPFADVNGEQKWKTFNNTTMNEIFETLESNRDDDLHSVLILDDIGSQLRKSAGAEKQLVSLLQNRRHMFCSVFILVQKYKDLPSGIRNNLSHFVTFRPKNQMEMESICMETMPFCKKHWQQIMNYVFDNTDKFSFLMIDMSLKQTNKYRYFRKFNEMTITDKTIE